MTTGASHETPDPDPSQPAEIRAEDYADLRGPARRPADETIGTTQSAALTDSWPDPHQQVDQQIERIQQLREQAAGLLHDAPVLVDVVRLEGPPGDSGPYGGDPPDHAPPSRAILAVRGELLLRVPNATGLDFDREAAARGGEETDAWQRAVIALENRQYTTSPVHDFPLGQLPLLRFSKDVHGPDELVGDRNAVRAETGAEVDLNYVVTAGHTVKAADYPVPAASHRCYSPEWIRRHPVHRTINVAVIDTGINHQSRTDGWLTGIPEEQRNEDPLDVYPVTQEPDGQIKVGDNLLDAAAGHGTFVSGVVEQVAPLSGIRVYRAVDTLGWGTSDAIGSALIQAATEGADIINTSLGTMTVDNLPPLAFTLALEIAQTIKKGILVVASAGNMGLDTPMFPAAMKGVVGVGALDASLNPAPWSGFGFWVDCSAIGVGVTSTFVPGIEPTFTADGTQVDEEFDDNAWAIWSGTSFSAPQIAGAIAQLCQLNNVDPAESLDQLFTRRNFRPGYGFVVPILPGS
ncbi:MAG TPA: S8 family serine peptidase [Streptosporangiaceae bacterium]|jgi:hypothetical protein